MTSDEIRFKAADLLEAHPDAWQQGAYRTAIAPGRYAYCLVGACREVVGYYDANAAYAATASAPHVAPTIWNDTPGRTREQVIAALRAI